MLKMLKIVGTICFVMFSVFGCSSVGVLKRVESFDSKSRLVIMTFNVENLFDLRDDLNKDDQTFLPLALKKSDKHVFECNKIKVPKWKQQCLEWDWSAEVLDTKLKRLASVILQVNQGRGPDILILQEVENLLILEKLRSEYLQAAEYIPGILIEGNDKRGIDVAILTRLMPMQQPKLHPIVFDSNVEALRIQDTRGILEATLALPDGEALTVFAVHFPAPFHPTAMRLSAFNTLNNLKDQLPEERASIAAGDFNVTAEEESQLSLLKNMSAGRWLVAHFEGCSKCLGTNYYEPKKSWSFLDTILFSKHFSSNDFAERGDFSWKLDVGSIQIPANAEGQKNAMGHPIAFELPNPKGVSDHFPMAAEIYK
jgi:endonuclease/exonuclease/phosphatase family metal-dependent hydrolase